MSSYFELPDAQSERAAARHSALAARRALAVTGASPYKAFGGG